MAEKEIEGCPYSDIFQREAADEYKQHSPTAGVDPGEGAVAEVFSLQSLHTATCSRTGIDFLFVVSYLLNIK